jgi:hypothetical protein
MFKSKQVGLQALAVRVLNRTKLLAHVLGETQNGCKIKVSRSAS